MIGIVKYYRSSGQLTAVQSAPTPSRPTKKNSSTSSAPKQYETLRRRRAGSTEEDKQDADKKLSSPGASESESISPQPTHVTSSPQHTDAMSRSVSAPVAGHASPIPSWSVPAKASTPPASADSPVDLPLSAHRIDKASTKAQPSPVFPRVLEPTPSTKIPEPTPSQKVPEPSPSPRVPEPSPSPRVAEPAPVSPKPTPKTSEPSTAVAEPSPRIPEPSPSPRIPEPSPRVPEPSPRVAQATETSDVEEKQDSEAEKHDESEEEEEEEDEEDEGEEEDEADLTEVTFSDYSVKNKGIVGIASLQGSRPANEDRFLSVMSLPSHPELELHAVFDGHDGPLASAFCKKHFIKTLVTRKSFPGNPGEALTQAFLRVDKRFLDTLEDGGTTAVVVLAGGGVLRVANAGDSRCVASVDGKAVPLSHDHKPDLPAEQARIEAANHEVQKLTEMMNGQRIKIARVDGELAVSRAIGDSNFKDDPSLKPENQAVTANPEITEVKLTPAHRFVVLACDGLWDVMSNQEVVDFISSRMTSATSHDELANIAKELAHHSIHDLQSTDNVTVVIVRL